MHYINKNPIFSVSANMNTYIIVSDDYFLDLHLLQFF
jgi:hypothetical protein